ncbi:MAG: Periplasmic trehalase precursor [candidate division WS6 bacterium OLB20]|uniref:Periplasmic trehalase n=1 Tax=candidate division WS6 bacterium OLB20 TaxID=1617426 RepID=A0A136LZ26_9BACT|nr:MAG: Periplasmic trehalase precursor [candidate division WS6 bacterium OLB20]
MNYRQKILSDETIAYAVKAISGISNYKRKADDLPGAFIPASDEFFAEQFYWDSYFIILGLLELGDEGLQTALDMIANMNVLLDRYGYIPNSSHSYTTRSQPPLFSEAVAEIYRKTEDLNWLKTVYPYMVKEYLNIWTSVESGHYHKDSGMSFYHDYSEPHNETWGTWYGAEQESGWDNTSRFQQKTDVILPVDLNAILYGMECNLTAFARTLSADYEADIWAGRAEDRKHVFDDYFWSTEEGFYYDYNMVTRKKMSGMTLAAYFPLWTGLASEQQAVAAVKQLSVFERGGGLAATEERLADPQAQWSYPNGWPPLHWVTVQGLRKYGFDDDADRIAWKWMSNCARSYKDTGRWDEKLSVANGLDKTDDPRYGHQNITYWNTFVFRALYGQVAG